MGYSKQTFKKATALDYAQIDHYNRSLKDSSITPLDTSAMNQSKFQNQKLGEQGYRLELEIPTQNNTIMNDSDKKISRENLAMEGMVGDSFMGKESFQDNQVASRPSYNPADVMISPSPDLSTPLDEEPRDYNNQSDKLGGLTSGLS